MINIALHVEFEFDRTCFIVDESAAIDQAVLSQMTKLDSGWHCLACGWETSHKTRLYEHVEAKHVQTNGYSCPICEKVCQSKNALKCHRYKYHRFVNI